MVEDYTLKVDLYLSHPNVTSRKKFTQHINNATEHFFDYDDYVQVQPQRIINVPMHHKALKSTK